MWSVTGNPTLPPRSPLASTLTCCSSPRRLPRALQASYANSLAEHGLMYRSGSDIIGQLPDPPFSALEHTSPVSLA